MSDDRQRIDKWLWHARVVRTRSAAAGLANSGHVRVNGARIDAASRAVKAGDVITIALDRVVRVLKVSGFAERRGDAEAARPLYEDLTVPPPATAAAEARPPASPALAAPPSGSGGRSTGCSIPTRDEKDPARQVRRRGWRWSVGSPARASRHQHSDGVVAHV